MIVKRLLFAVTLALLGTLVATGIASAHERRAVGDYQFVVGFLNEPAINEEPNGLSLRVTKGQGNNGTPVEGLANTLKVEVKYGGQTMPLTLEAAFGNPGSYEAHFIPTAEGAYIFHISGTIENQPVDESFESGPNTFSEVESRSAMSFPNKVDSVGAVAKTAGDAKDTASSARMFGILGMIFGVIGIGVGIAGVTAARGARAGDSAARPEPRDAATES
jgi:hypothetical protein